jgi:hypothetical protein
MKALTLGAFALALALPLAGHAADYAVQPAQSKLGFSSDFQGTAFDGSFAKWTAAISYDPANLAADKFDVTVDLASVHTGDKDRDGIPNAYDRHDNRQQAWDKDRDGVPNRYDRHPNRPDNGWQNGGYGRDGRGYGPCWLTGVVATAATCNSGKAPHDLD